MVRHLVESQQLSVDALFKIFKRADFLRAHQKSTLKNKLLTTLFYEPSTRTRLSFESAMLKLGGSVIGTESAKEFSSVSKGESLEDTIRVIGAYSDIIVLRSSEEGAALSASMISKVPIINGGDGKGQHPTQAILDLYTIYREFKRLNNLKIAIVGDLKSGRTVHSLCYLLGKFKNIKIILISPPHLKVGENIKEYLTKHKIFFEEREDMNSILPFVDVVYMTRIQKERMCKTEYDKANGCYKINLSNINLLRRNTRIMHPLPHVTEIDLPFEVEENDPRVAYFRQAENGLYVRMAILEDLLLSKRSSRLSILQRRR
ncbi:MAG: aspartate carbamoyltransferase [archaeon]|nr:aspartate carbamoyltransferase [archaeon]MCR4323517.1 aspartate carbamoyltransferase [Nanoarchaeota archaeon]